MGYVKEPEGVDFVINSRQLTEEDKKDISEFIRQYKAKKKVRNKITPKNKKSAA